MLSLVAIYELRHEAEGVVLDKQKVLVCRKWSGTNSVRQPHRQIIANQIAALASAACVGAMNLSHAQATRGLGTRLSMSHNGGYISMEYVHSNS